MRSDEDFNQELQAHIAIEADRLRADGMGAADADAAARKAFGNIAATREGFYEAQRWMFVEHLAQDCRYAARSLWHNPALTLAAVLCIALGIGANAAVFTLIDSVILRMLPVKAPEQLYEFGQSFSTFEYRTFLAHNNSFTAIIASGGEGPRDVSISDGTSERLKLAIVSGNYFAVLGVEQAAGRLLAPSDETTGAAPAAVLNYDYWKNRFALDPSTIGTHIRIGTGVFTVVGVAQKSFFGEAVGSSPDIWIPAQTVALAYPGKDMLNAKDVHWLTLIGRLKREIQPAQAAAPFTAMKHQMDIDRAGSAGTPEFIEEVRRESILLKPAGKGRSQVGPAAVRTLWVLFAVSGLVLLVACVNVANLLLARASARQREITIRISLGAGRARLIRQLLTESVLLGTLGGALGLNFAVLLSQGLLRLGSDTDAPIPLHIGPDLRMLGFTFGISVLSGFLFGLVPAWQGSRSDPYRATNGNCRSNPRATRSQLGSVLAGA
jgi:predicted permease